MSLSGKQECGSCNSILKQEPKTFRQDLMNSVTQIY